MVGEAAAGATGRAGAGPALMISFILVAIACSFAALCYAEFASMAPVSGSAYTYAYATLGELTAWIIGWDLILEYAVGNIAVAISWSDYLQTLLSNFHLTWPALAGTDFGSAMRAARKLRAQAQGVDLSTLGGTVLQAAQAWNDAPTARRPSSHCEFARRLDRGLHHLDSSVRNPRERKLQHRHGHH